MSPLIGALLLYLLAMIGFMLGSVWLIRTYVRHTVGRRHQILQHIIEKGDLPEQWLTNGKVSALATKNLYKLTNYVRKTRLVDSEETRVMLLSKLEHTRVKGEG